MPGTVFSASRVLTEDQKKELRYYVCASAREHGWQNCPAPSVAAGPVEQLVVEQIHKLGPEATRLDCVPLWGTLPPPEQARLVRLLVEGVDYDHSQGKITITFQPQASQIFARELAQPQAQEHSA